MTTTLSPSLSFVESPSGTVGRFRCDTGLPARVLTIFSTATSAYPSQATARARYSAFAGLASALEERHLQSQPGRGSMPGPYSTARPGAEGRPTCAFVRM